MTGRRPKAPASKIRRAPPRATEKKAVANLAIICVGDKSRGRLFHARGRNVRKAGDSRRTRKEAAMVGFLACLRAVVRHNGRAIRELEKEAACGGSLKELAKDAAAALKNEAIFRAI